MVSQHFNPIIMRNTQQKMILSWMVILLSASFFNGFSQIADNEIVIRPAEIYDVLTNPGIGFMTFQRFNGDELNDGTILALDS